MKIKNRNNFVAREELSIGPLQGLYNQQLWDLCSTNALASLSLEGSVNPALDIIGWDVSDVHRIEEQMISYIAPDGTADGSPSVGYHADPCAPGNTFEWGGCGFVLEGWGRIRRASQERDITDAAIRYCETQPRYRIDGRQIMNDYEWDLVQMAAVLNQDIQRQFIVGNNTVDGQADGLRRLVNYGYTDPVTGEACSSMDATVVDYNGNTVLLGDGPNAVSVNGSSIGTTWNFIDIVNSWARRVAQRINMSSLTGVPVHIGLAPTEFITCLLEAWVCYTVCAGDSTRMDSFEARSRLETLMSQFGGYRSVTLSFHGVPITFIPYDYELIEGDGESEVYILTPRVGNTPLLRGHVKDMNAAFNASGAGDYGNRDRFRVTDGNRLLSWDNTDHTCFKVNAEMQFRWLMRAPWAQLRFTNVACSTPFGHISGDPLSAAYPESNLVKADEAVNYVTQVAAQAVDDLYYEDIDTQLVVNAANGVLANDIGEPAPTATPIAAGASTEGGTVNLSADGSFTYDPPSATFTGVDTFDYTIDNGYGSSDTGTVTIIVYDTNA